MTEGRHESGRAHQGNSGKPKDGMANDRTRAGQHGTAVRKLRRPLAAIPAICGLIGWVLVGLPLSTGVLITLVRYVLSFAAVYLVALIIDALAPTFDGAKSFDNALKLSVYSVTPFWLAGVFLLIP